MIMDCLWRGRLPIGCTIDARTAADRDGLAEFVGGVWPFGASLGGVADVVDGSAGGCPDGRTAAAGQEESCSCNALEEEA